MQRTRRRWVGARTALVATEITASDIVDSLTRSLRLRNAAEKAKRLLSSATSADIDVESLAEGVDFTATLTRAKFDSLNEKFFARCLETVKKVMKDARMKVTDISELVLVGARVSCFGRSTVYSSIYPAHSIACAPFKPFAVPTL